MKRYNLGGVSLGMVITLVLLGFLMLLFCTFTVNEKQRAIKFRFGEISRSDYEPGLHFMIPIWNNIRKFDGRILTLDLEPDRYLTSETKVVIVDVFVKWRIGPRPEDVVLFYTALSGDEDRARLAIDKMIRDRLRAEFALRKIQEAIAVDRAKMMAVLKDNLAKQTQTLGIEIVDVRIKRVDFPSEVSENVFQSMRQERVKVANELRSQGVEQAETIRAEADRQVVVKVAEASRTSEQLRGEGDAKAAEIYAQAYSQDPEFFAFYRSLNAYQIAFKNSSGNVMVLPPNSEFFQYFKDSKSAAK
jgi:modulator of FtsH protease HflC